MKLKSFGCSLIFGTDLHDDGRNGLYAKGSYFTYPALIAKSLGHDYATNARPGASNLEILSKILAHLQTGDPAICVINWTYLDRFGYVKEEFATSAPLINPMGWRSIMPIDDDDVAKFYHKSIHSQTRDKFESLVAIKSAIDALRASGSQFIMTWTDDLLWETKWHAPPAVLYLQQEIKPYLTDFEGIGFLEWSRSRKFPISATQHPLEQAHAAAADLILSSWDDYIKS